MAPHFRMQGAVEAGAMTEHHLAAFVVLFSWWRDVQTKHLVLQRRGITKATVGVIFG